MEDVRASHAICTVSEVSIIVGKRILAWHAQPGLHERARDLLVSSRPAAGTEHGGERKNG